MTIQIIVPDLGESVVEATVSRWLKKAGDPVNAGEAVVVLETDKVDLEVAAQRAGTLANISAPEGSDVAVGAVLGEITEGASAAPAAEPAAEPAAAPATVVSTPPPAATAPAPPPTAHDGGKPATPVAQRMAREQQVDLGSVPTSGSRVTKADVERFVAGSAASTAPAPSAPPVPAAPPAASMPSAPSAADPRGEERTRLTRRRRTIAQRLVEVQQTAAILTTFNEIDMTAVQATRARHKDRFKERYNVNLGLSSFFVKAAIGALKSQPLLNAEIQGDEIVMKHYYDIGVAIGAPEGLVVPVLRNADRMSFAGIEKAIKEYAKQANDGTLTLEALRGGTFTITNGGVFGSLLSTPILNPPQVGILGLHKIEERPIAKQGEVVIRPMMYVALSYDHRIVDGREAVQFLVRVKELIEDPESLLIEG